MILKAGKGNLMGAFFEGLFTAGIRFIQGYFSIMGQVDVITDDDLLP